MGTKLFNSVIVGPIHSRRLGNSLGINLLPKYGKICNFDCIYCECGWNKENKEDNKLATKEIVEKELSLRLKEIATQGGKIDSITFSGNGEPTINPHFAEIVDITIKLRDQFFPKAKISVLSNSTMIGKKEIREALMKVDNPILKIDSALNNFVNLINIPSGTYSLDKTIENLKKFNGNFILQTMFLKGKIEKDGKEINIDCTEQEHVIKWIELVRYLKPRQVMMYSLDRETPAKNLEKISGEQMRKIAEPLLNEGFNIQINE